MNKYRIIRKKSDQQIYLAEFQIEGWKYHGPYKDVKAARAARNRKEKDEMMRDIGLVKCKDSAGRTIWE